MRVAVLSIHEVHAEDILSGSKVVEYRKRPISSDIETVYLYQTAPTSLIVAKFQVVRQEIDTPARLIRRHGRNAAERKALRAYFGDRNAAVGILVRDPVRLKVPRKLSAFGLRAPPQSFAYAFDPFVKA